MSPMIALRHMQDSDQDLAQYAATEGWSSSSNQLYAIGSAAKG
jgi:hypothetical protein